ncbi:c-type cytochrome [Acuticoccus mangrovi]|uniref:Cytochrome c n=1 Tax=Acuticoccus mangrovi TaxID=2796142 RepID=A0A934IT01_9HYPH|nr:c-type cytochrome [Acuticoccus mangrovi]MBJ3777129.1 cytochrome c [Acuticoccus mangrovi]
MRSSGRAIAVLVAAILAAAAPAAHADALLERGRALYEGTAGPLPTAIGGRTILARGVTCSGCHGRDAGGGRETRAGPPIDWATLMAATATRPAYDTAGVYRATTAGLDVTGTPFASTMPRFVLNPTDLDALAAYLKAIAAEQRLGRTDEAIGFLAPDLARTPAGNRFREAFEATVLRLAPHGVFGRRIEIVAAAPAFATLAAPVLRAHPPMPDLFPAAPLVGDEAPGDVRGASASIARQVEALIGSATSGCVVAAADLRARLAPLVDAVDGTDWRWCDAPSGGVTLALGTALADAVRAADGPVLALADDLVRLAVAPPDCLSVADPHPPSGAGGGAPAERFGTVAAETLIETLKLCGPDCTRARLIEAFDAVRVPERVWPALDYGRQPLTGTDAVAIHHLCTPIEPSR